MLDTLYITLELEYSKTYDISSSCLIRNERDRRRHKYIESNNITKKWLNWHDECCKSFNCIVCRERNLIPE